MAAVVVVGGSAGAERGVESESGVGVAAEGL